MQDLNEVAGFIIALEEAARVIWKAEILGGAKPFPAGARAALARSVWQLNPATAF